jgi:cytoskeleton protein RodZ
MGFDLAKIASELHLTTSVVERLEADDYEDIGARVFVRGYLRNYARIVDMPSDSILRQFDEKWPEEPSKGATVRESPRLPADGGAGRGWAGVTTWVVVIGAIALFVMWWHGYLDEVPPPEITAETPGFVEETMAELTDIASMNEAPAGGDLSAPDGGLRLPTRADEVGIAGDRSDPSNASDDVVPSEIAPAMPPAGDAAVGDPAAESRADAAGILPVLAPAVPAGADTTTASGEDAAGAGGVPEPTPGVVMTFSAPCWVDVRDSTRKFKLFGEMPKGAREVLGGEPPYQFVVGNARAVTLEVDGEPFDIMPYAKGNVARFTLNP